METRFKRLKILSLVLAAVAAVVVAGMFVKIRNMQGQINQLARQVNRAAVR